MRKRILQDLQVSQAGVARSLRNRILSASGAAAVYCILSVSGAAAVYLASYVRLSHVHAASEIETK